MILPAYFDKTPFGKLFHNEPAPWALSEEADDAVWSQQRGQHRSIDDEQRHRDRKSVV